MGVIRRGDDSKLALKLLQTEDARAVKALHATQSLTTLHLSAEMTRLNPLMVRFSGSFHTTLYHSSQHEQLLQTLSFVKRISLTPNEQKTKEKSSWGATPIQK